MILISSQNVYSSLEFHNQSKFSIPLDFYTLYNYVLLDLSGSKVMGFLGITTCDGICKFLKTGFAAQLREQIRPIAR